MRWGDCCAVRHDLADPYACAELFDRVEETLGSVEILVDNAA
jgi:NAD(P)-dependent dehydrogenase (short-subunit alcohol dehydrogenase family)